MSAQNKYIVTWDIYANTETAVSNIKAFTSTIQTQNRALRTGITNLKEYNKQLISLRGNMKRVGGVMSSTGRAAVGQGMGVFPNTKAAKGYAGWNSMIAPPFAPTPVISNSRMNSIAKKQMAAQGKATAKAAARGAAVGGARGGFVSPLKGTPFGGLMGTLLAYSAISSNVTQAAEYDNLMTTAKSFLRVADEDLSSFESRFDALATNVRQVGLETKFTATQVAGATKYLAMAGMNVDAINKSIKPIADLALIGDEDLALIADLSTNIMTGYGLDEGAMSNVSDIISSTMTRSNVSITEIAESFKMAAGYLSASGVEFSEATAAIGVLGDAGMKATLAGTALRAMMIRFAKPTKEAKKVMEGFGVTFTETVDVMGEKVTKVRPLVDIFTELKEKGAGLEDLQRMFGTIGGNAALQLLNRTDKLGELTRQNRFSHGTSDFLADEKKNVVTGLWYQMTSKFQDQFLVAFQRLAPSIEESLKVITDLFSSNSFVDGLETLGRGLLTLTEAAMKLGVWVGNNWNWIQPLIIGKFIYGNITNITNGLIGLGSSLSGIVTAGAGLSAVAGGWLTLAAALVSGLAAYTINANAITTSNDRIVASIKEATPSVSTNINEWATAVGKFRDNLVSADGSINDIKTSLSGKTVSEYTGVGDEEGLFTSNKTIMLNNRKQIDAYTGLQQTMFYNALTEDISKLDINAKNYPEQLDKLYNSLSDRYFDANKSLNESEYKSIRLPLYEHPKYKSFESQDEFKTREDYDRAIEISRHPRLRFLPQYSRIFTEISSNLSDKNADIIRYTEEYKTSFAQYQENLFNNILSPFKGWMSTPENAAAQVIKMMGSKEIEYLTGLGILKDGAFTQDIKGLQLDGADMINVRNLIQNLISNSLISMANGDKFELDGGMLAQLIARAKVPSVFWDADPLNTNKTNIVSGLSKDDEDEKSTGSTKGLRGASNQPRQVIVNLDNLLNIEMVEIDNTNQDIEISSIKEKLAQALLDVVADYSASYHG